MKPSKAEQVVQVVFLISVIGLTMCMTFAQVSLRRFGRPYVPIELGAAFLCLVSTVISYIALNNLTKERLKAEIEKSELIRKEATYSQPDFSQVDTTGSILALFWSVDYKGAMKLNLRMTVTSMLFWLIVILPIVLNVLAALRSPAKTNFSVLFLVYLGVLSIFLVFWFFLLSLSMKAYYGSTTATQHTGLVISGDGMHYLVGKEKLFKPWSELKSITERWGIVITRHTDGQRMIPDFAFHSKKDAKALVATAKALKSGEPVPAHDWSAYKPQVPTTEGAWPPAVT